MKKKLLLIFSGLLLLLLGLLLAVPFFLEARIGTILRNTVNSNINGTFDFAEADLSLIRSFPNAELRLQDLYVINKAPFEGDTLVKSGQLSLTLGLGELFKGAGEPIGIKRLDIDGALLNILVNEEEVANYDIATASESEGKGEPSDSGFSFDMQSYTISNSEIRYTDRSSGIALRVEEILHRGSGDLSLDTSELETETSALLSLDMDSTNYLNRNPVRLNALIGIDLPQNTYTFLKNEALVNQLPLVFDGYVRLFDDYQEINLRFRTPSSDFKNFLAVIPESYSRNIEGVHTTGNFVVEGDINGKLDDTHIPPFSIKMFSENASFKYPDLPRTVSNIYLDAQVTNTSGLAEDTFVTVNKASFNIDSDRFNLTTTIRELMGNTRVDAHVDGRMNLANLAEAYPVPADLKLRGLLVADIQTAFDMASVEKRQYGNTRTSGSFALSDFEYASAELANPVKISSMKVALSPETVRLNELAGTTGGTDFKASGTIRNLLGFLFNKEVVEGNFNLSSDTFVLNDFMVAEAPKEAAPAETTPGQEETIKIPSFLDCTIQANANTVRYDNLTLKDVSGTLRIKDETATLSNMTSSIFNGKLALNGSVSTREVQPVFNMQLGMDGFRIGETFQALDLFQALAPVANALEGTLNSRMDISGVLSGDFTPVLTSISGDALAELLGTELNPEKARILNALGSKLNFIKANDFNLGGLKTALSFEKGQVRVKPFTISYKDIAIQVAGGHGFDRSLNYTATLQVPARYLGNEVTGLLASIDSKELGSLTIPVTATIGGNYSDPTVSTDLTSGITSLTAQLVEIQKQKLISQGQDKARDLIGGLLSGNSQKGDSLEQETKETEVKDIVGGILNGNTGRADSTKVSDSVAAPADPVRETAKNILGGLLGKKKKDGTPAKDTVQ